VWMDADHLAVAGGCRGSSRWGRGQAIAEHALGDTRRGLVQGRGPSRRWGARRQFSSAIGVSAPGLTAGRRGLDREELDQSIAHIGSRMGG